MKTNMTISIDTQIKHRMQHIAKGMGTNISNLVNMYFAHVINT